jgi:hypothetical protein
MPKLSFLFVLLATTLAKAETQDLLLQKTLALQTNQIETVLSKTEANIQVFVENFEVKLDSGSKITQKKQIGGTLLQPVLKVSVKKCVFIFCQDVDLDAEFTLIKIQGACNFNYRLAADIQRSSPLLSDLYTTINTDICIQKTATGADAQLKVTLVHSDAYESGIVQKQAFGFIKLQADSLLTSFTNVMKLNGVTAVK